MTPADLLDYALHGLMRAMPIGLSSGLGAALSPLMGARAHPVADARARALLCRLHPELAADPAALDREVALLWRQVGRTFAEFAVSGRILRAGRAALEGVAALDAAYASGRAVVLAYPHTGNWEIALAQMARHRPGRLLVVVDLPQREARARIAMATRTRLPASYVRATPAMWRAAVSHLATPGNVLFLAVDGQEDGLCGFPAFDRPVPQGGSAAKLVRLARRANALIVPLHNERLEGARFVTRVQPAFDPVELGQEAALATLTARLEPVVRRLATQWYMALMVASS